MRHSMEDKSYGFHSLGIRAAAAAVVLCCCHPLAMGSDLRRRHSKVRMGTLVIETTPGAEVRVEQQRHEFWFGAALASQMFGERANPEVAAQYKRVFLENFNAAVTENALKWPSMERRQGQVDYSVVDAILPMDRRARNPAAGPQYLLGDSELRPAVDPCPGRCDPAPDAQGQGPGHRHALSRPVRRVRPEQRDDPRQLLRGASGPADHAGHGRLGPPGRPQRRPLPERLRHPHGQPFERLRRAHPRPAGSGRPDRWHRRAGAPPRRFL